MLSFQCSTKAADLFVHRQSTWSVYDTLKKWLLSSITVLQQSHTLRNLQQRQEEEILIKAAVHPDSSQSLIAFCIPAHSFIAVSLFKSMLCSIFIPLSKMKAKTILSTDGCQKAFWEIQ